MPYVAWETSLPYRNRFLEGLLNWNVIRECISRIGFKTVNLPISLSGIIDSWLAEAAMDINRDAVRGRAGRQAGSASIQAASPGGPPIYGVQSRDEYVRLAVSVFMIATAQNDSTAAPLEIIRDLVAKLERARG
jgi:hypothetical protein